MNPRRRSGRAKKLSLGAFQEPIESSLKGCHVHCLGLVARSLSCWLDEPARNQQPNWPPNSTERLKTGGISKKRFLNQLQTANPEYKHTHSIPRIIN